MSKRRAGVELTHDNWDQEDEEKEEAGSFAVADKDTLSRRPMIKAKRRVTGQQEGSQAPPTQTPFAAFKGFSGFGSTKSSTTSSAQPATASFSFKPVSTASSNSPLSQNTATFGSAPSAQSEKPVSESKPKYSFMPSSKPSKLFGMSETESDSKPATISSNGSAFGAKSANGNDAYAHELKSLNQSVSAWIIKHVDSNPVCDLTPIFEDYKKHLGEIEKKRSTQKEESGAESKTKPQLATVSPPKSGQDKSSTASSFTGFKFGSTSSAAAAVPAATDSSAPKAGFSFGSTASSDKGFSFGSTTSSSLASSSAASFSFAGLQSKPTASTSRDEKEGDTQDEDAPPKVEIKVIEEKDALFSTRCKVFYKKGSEFKERGVGMMHIKDTGGAGQILVRADTTLGNVILNIGVSASMLDHFTKQGKNKNNVMMLSALNPPAEKKCPKCNKNYLNPQESTACEGDCAPDPSPILLRVKTEADADKLIEKLKKIFD